jgi:WhiB family redox-sensing transcriptional regulator
MRGWQHQAECRGIDPELFFPSGRDDSHLVQAHLGAVRGICAACAVASECRRWAIDTGQEYGLWAATTPTERRRERRRARERRRHAASSSRPDTSSPAGFPPAAVARTLPPRVRRGERDSS